MPAEFSPSTLQRADPILAAFSKSLSSGKVDFTGDTREGIIMCHYNMASSKRWLEGMSLQELRLHAQECIPRAELIAALGSGFQGFMDASPTAFQTYMDSSPSRLDCVKSRATMLAYAAVLGLLYARHLMVVASRLSEASGNVDDLVARLAAPCARLIAPVAAIVRACAGVAEVHGYAMFATPAAKCAWHAWEVLHLVVQVVVQVEIAGDKAGKRKICPAGAFLPAMRGALDLVNDVEKLFPELSTLQSLTLGGKKDLCLPADLSFWSQRGAPWLWLSMPSR